ncbi:MAG: hypothetical protein INR68_03750 [Methylobacterium mesophilicum]|nr:hypothetical protein [Methylobacterium mesophilicum]
MAGGLLLLGVAGSGAVTRNACVAGDPAVAGRYDLENVLNVGSRVTLKSDGTFDYRLSYGSVAQRGKGCWSVDASGVTLMPTGATQISDTPVLDRTEFSGLVLQREGSDLLWRIGGAQGDAARVGRYVKQ